MSADGIGTSGVAREGQIPGSNEGPERLTESDHILMVQDIKKNNHLTMIMATCAILLTLALAFVSWRTAESASSTSNSLKEIAGQRVLTADVLLASSEQQHCVNDIQAEFSLGISKMILVDPESKEFEEILEEFRPLVNKLNMIGELCYDSNPIPEEE